MNESVLAPVDRLRQLRVGLGLTQDTVQRRLGLVGRTDQVSRWETGVHTPSLSSLCRWGYVLDHQLILSPYGFYAWWENVPYRERPKLLMGVMRLLRQEKDLTQKEVAAAIGTSNQRISRWELAQELPKVATFIDWAAVFDQKLRFIITASRGSQ